MPGLDLPGEALV